MKLLMSTALATGLVALAVPALASAHYGDRWFQTAAATQTDIKDRYRIGVAACFIPKQGSMSATRYNVHLLRDSFKTMADHLMCVVESEVTQRVCSVVAHHAGKEWWQIVLTSYLYNGCGPADIRKRS